MTTAVGRPTYQKEKGKKTTKQNGGENSENCKETTTTTTTDIDEMLKELNGIYTFLSRKSESLQYNRVKEMIGREREKRLVVKKKKRK